MKAAKSTVTGEVVEVVKRRRKSRAVVDPPVLARHILVLLRDAGLSTRSIARVVAELPASHTAARRALASVNADEAHDDD
jgi:predicted nucleic acid-binding protein